MPRNPKEPARDQDPVSHVDLDQSSEEVLDYWTEERMAEARPRELKLPAPGPADQD